MKKVLKVMLSLLITMGTFNPVISVFAETTTDQSKRINWALEGNATASTVEVSYYGANKVNDGIINRNVSDKKEQSRWSSGAKAPQWIQIDLNEEREFDEIVIAFENAKVRQFHIETSNDGKIFEERYMSSNEPTGHPMDTRVLLENPVNARYVKLTIDSLIDGAYPSVSLYELEIWGNQNIKNNNIAPDAAVESNHQEASTTSATNVIDEVIAQNSRWSSDYKSGPNILTFTYTQEKTIQSVVLEWERCNATSYSIQAYINNNWETVYQNTTPAHFTDKINFDNSVTTTKLRLVIDSFENKAPNRDGKEINYPTISLYEVLIFSEQINVSKPTVDEVANRIIVDSIADTDKKLKMPKVPEGFEISFIGADYEQVIAHDMTISRPLTTKNVVVNFEITKIDNKNEKATTPDIVVSVPGLYNQSDSKNEKPKVLPEIQEWFGRDGQFEITNSTRIVVDPSARSYKETAQTFAVDYKDIVGKEIKVVEGNHPSKGDFYFTMSDEQLDEETYVVEVEDFVTIKASQNTGAYWATRTILQILKQTKTNIVKGVMKDYPKYEVRGFMLDVARRPFQIEFLEDLVKTMSWYKLNNFHVHLSDNTFRKLDDGKTSEYSAFRLESNIPNLTNKDLYYTKNEFRNFIVSSQKLGVEIVPEFDSPGHSGAFTRARPDLARQDNYDYLDVENPDSLEFIKSVFAEYITGDNPVFPKGTVVHVGTDEYKKGNKEAFRKFQDGILRYILEQGYTPRVWGSQTENNGITPIVVDGVQMNLWYSGYAKPKDMYELGYDCINTNDGDLYIVPGAGYYHDYLSQSHIYGKWQPNIVAGYKIPVGSNQMLGSTFAVWNDKTGPTLDNGTSDLEVFDRIFHITPTFASKLWGDIKDYTIEEVNALTKVVKYAPNSNPTYEIETIDECVLDYNFNNPLGLDLSGNKFNLLDQVNVSYDKGKNNNALTLNGGKSYVETPLEDLGVGASIEFWIKRSSSSTDEEQILFESEKGAIKAVQKDTGKFGFSRELRDYSFDYELPKGEWVHIRLETQLAKTILYVNGESVGYVNNTPPEPVNNAERWTSLVIPLKRIGSKTKAFDGQIDDVILNKNVEINVTASSVLGDHRLPKYAFDGNPDSFWHSNNSSGYTLPQSITAELLAEQVIDEFTYLPRQDTNDNGIITKYRIETSIDGNNFTTVAEGTWEKNHELKHVLLENVKAKYVRLVALEAHNNVASAAEINIISNANNINIRPLREAIEKANLYLKDNQYTPKSIQKLKEVVDEALEIFYMPNNQDTIDQMVIKLDEYIDKLVIKADKTDLKKVISQAKSVDYSLYTDLSIQRLKDTIEEVESVCKDDNASITDVEEAKILINNALKHLELLDIKLLNKLIEEVKEIDENLYTRESISNLKSKLEQAQDALVSSNQNKIDIAYKELKKAKDNLVKKAFEEVEKPNENKPINNTKPIKDKTQEPVVNSQEKINSNVLGNEISVKDSKDNYVKTNDSIKVTPYIILLVCAVSVYITIKKENL